MRRISGTCKMLRMKTEIQFFFVVLYCLTLCNKALGNPFAIPKDNCSSFDTCSGLDYFRTCSCDEDCYRYGTCCWDAGAKGTQPAEYFKCYSDFVAQPVFVKEMCSATFDGDKGIIRSCEKSVRDWSDLMVNVLVSSNETWATYKNWNCAVCNNEKEENLWFWTVQASYAIHTAQNRLSVRSFRKNFVYDDTIEKWGVYDKDTRFIDCPLELYQPVPLTGLLRYCAGDVTSTCLSTWDDTKIERKCASYYGERKLQHSKTYFRNVHCALCNGLEISDLECSGRNYRPTYRPGDNFDMRVVFNLNPWTEAYKQGQPSCPSQQRYDPFLRTCRSIECGLKDPKSNLPCGAESGTDRIRIYHMIIILNLLVCLRYITSK